MSLASIEMLCLWFALNVFAEQLSVPTLLGLFP